MKYFPCYCSIILLICSCQSPPTPADPFIHLTDEDVTTILQQSIETSGGWQQWQNKEALHFEKYFALYDSTGAMENEVTQIHHYQYQPRETIHIRWTKEGKSHEILTQNEEITKTIDGQPDQEASATSLKNTVLSSTFVVGLPFKLLDQGVVLNYAGTDTLEGYRPVEVIKAVFNPDKNPHHSTPDTWWCYFDASQGYKMVAYMVQHADHYSYVRNESDQTINGFLFPKDRKSYRVDADRDILYLRAVYRYQQ